MKIVCSVTVFLGIVISTASMAEKVPSNGYIQYQKTRASQALPELESYGASVVIGNNSSTIMSVNHNAFHNHLSQYVRVFNEMPSDADELRLHIYTPPNFNEESLDTFITSVSDKFKAVYVIKKLSCESGCENFELNIF